MSSICFHTLSNEVVSVSGSERAYAGWILNSLTLGILVDGLDVEELKVIIPKGSHLHQSDGRFFYNHFKSWWVVNSAGEKLSLDEVSADTVAVSLNTAITLGNDVIKFLARLYGTCELHAWVDGKNKEWLSGIIECGMNKKILRSGVGWDKVITLLKKDCFSEVVMSYSVCDQFPNCSNSLFKGKCENFDKLSEERQWKLGMGYLRQESVAKWLELKPETWDSYYFDTGMTAFDIKEYLSGLREKKDFS